MRNHVLCCFIVGWLLCNHAHSQSNGTLSHRLIPLEKDQKPPAMQDFMSLELLDMINEYRRISRQPTDTQTGRQRTSRLPRRPTSPAAQPELNPRRRQDRELVERFDQKTLESIANELAEEISSVNEQFGRELGGELTDTFEPDKIQFDPNEKADFWNSPAELLETIQNKTREATAQYNRAMKAYKQAWPTDSIPPREWIEKVQPYINPELVRQFAEANKASLTSTESASKNGPFHPYASSSNATSNSSTSISVNENNRKNTSRGVLDSVISAVDKRSTQWLKAAKDRNKTGRQSSWWKSIKARSKDRISLLNQKITGHSRDMSTRRSRSWSAHFPSLRRTPSAVNPLERTGFGAIALLFVVLATIVGGSIYWLRFQRDSTHTLAALRVDATMIRDRDSLLRACHHLTLRCFGWPSRFWHHREVFAQIGNQADNREQSVNQLCNIYEHARYSRDGMLSSEDLTVARRLFEQIQDVRPVAQ